MYFKLIILWVRKKIPNITCWPFLNELLLLADQNFSNFWCHGVTKCILCSTRKYFSTGTCIAIENKFKLHVHMTSLFLVNLLTPRKLINTGARAHTDIVFSRALLKVLAVWMQIANVTIDSTTSKEKNKYKKHTQNKTASK